MGKITEGTLVPISLVIVLVGGIFWLTQLYFTTQSNASTIEKMQIQSEKIDQSLSEILERLARIEERIKRRAN